MNDFEQFGQFPTLSDSQIRFLTAFQLEGKIGQAAESSNVSRTIHYHWKQTSEEYAAAFKSVQWAVIDRIHEPLVERLANGWDEPVYQGGELVGYKRRFDNATAMRYLEAVDPVRFGGKRQIEISYPEGTKITPSDEVVAMDEMVPTEADN